ncbi:BTB POZ domain-containing protein [Rutstroemia sp. NJR-2017a BVV2]|nr:BTB POZ domain-containing protein [Rutstroemia sp. NJR-2017a BVV2]
MINFYQFTIQLFRGFCQSIPSSSVDTLPLYYLRGTQSQPLTHLNWLLKMSSENLIIETDGDLLLIFTRRVQKKDAIAVDGVLGKRKTPHDTSDTVTMLVSSKHMASASSVFKIMIEDKMQEVSETSKKAKIELLLPREDPTLFVIIANIIHGQNKTVPEKVDYKLLVSLGFVTKTYKLQECLRFAAISWINNLYPKGLGKFPDWVPGCSKEAVRIIFLIAILHSDGNFEFPLPPGSRRLPAIVAAMQKARLQVFNDLFAALRSFHMRGTEVISYCQTTPKDTCDFTTAGSFMKSCARHVAWPLPNPPYKGLRAKTVIENILKTGIQSRCKKSNPDSKDCINDQMFEKMIEVQIKVIESRISGTLERGPNLDYHSIRLLIFPNNDREN